MAWKQVKAFDINKMGKEAGMCLKNVRLGFGIAPKYPDAKAEWLAYFGINKDGENGTAALGC